MHTYREMYAETHFYHSLRRCKLPGPSPDQPVVYEFGVPYSDMFKELSELDAKL